MGNGLIDHVPAIDVRAVTLAEHLHVLFQTLQQRLAGERFPVVVPEHPQADLFVPHGRVRTHSHAVRLGIGDDLIRRAEVPNVLLRMDRLEFHGVAAGQAVEMLFQDVAEQFKIPGRNSRADFKVFCISLAQRGHFCTHFFILPFLILPAHRTASTMARVQGLGVWS